MGIVRLSSVSPFDQESRITGMVKSPIGSGVVSLWKLEKSINGSDYVRPVCLPSHNYSLAGIPCNTLKWNVPSKLIGNVTHSYSNKNSVIYVRGFQFFQFRFYLA